MSRDEEHTINFAAVKAAVESGLSALERDPLRGARNMLDLGKYFSHTHRQKAFFQMAQNVLGRKRSQYINLLKRAMASVDRETLKTVGINLGYFSWSRGARVIRSVEAERGFNVPWSFVIRMEDAGADSLTVDEARGFIAQARELGAHAFWITLCTERADACGIIDMCGSFSDCAFIFLTPAELITSAIAERARTQHNMLFCMRIESEETIARAAGILRGARLMYGLYMVYDDANCERILGGGMIRQADECGGELALFVSAPGCSEECRARVQEYAMGEKTVPEKPVFMVDFFSDLNAVDGIISSQPCYIEVDACGGISATPWGSQEGVNVRTHSLSEALSVLAPRRAE